MKLQTLIMLSLAIPVISGTELLKNGNFESGDIKNDFNISGKYLSSCSIEPSPAFLSGEKSFCLTVPAQGKTEASSKYFRVEPGKKLELKFWAKAESPQKLRVILDFGGKPHLYKSVYFNIPSEWKEFSLPFDIPHPGTEKDSNAPIRNNVRFRLVMDKPTSPAKVFFDDMSFSQN